MTNQELQHRRDATVTGLGSFTVVPSDSVSFSEPCRSFAVLAAGAVSFVGLDGVTDVYTFAGTTFPIFVPVGATRINATGTTVGAGNVKGIK